MFKFFLLTVTLLLSNQTGSQVLSYSIQNTQVLRTEGEMGAFLKILYAPHIDNFVTGKFTAVWKGPMTNELVIDNNGIRSTITWHYTPSYEGKAIKCFDFKTSKLTTKVPCLFRQTNGTETIQSLPKPRKHPSLNPLTI